MVVVPAPDLVGLVRRRYGEGASIKSICAEAGIRQVRVVYNCLDGKYPDGTGIRLTRIARRNTHRERPIAQERKEQPPHGRAALIERFWKTADRQIRAIERRLKQANIEIEEEVSNARVMAIMARTLRDLAAFDAKQKSVKEAPKDDDEVPRNIDDLRAELARRLEVLIAAEQDADLGEPEASSGRDVL